jgi:hypothetical protein
MASCGQVGRELVCGTDDESLQMGVADTTLYKTANWFSFRSWIDSGFALAGGDTKKAGQYFKAGCDPTIGRGGNGCLGLTAGQSGKLAAEGSKSKMFFGILSKAAGTPVGFLATFVDYGMVPPSEDEKRTYDFVNRWFD